MKSITEICPAYKMYHYTKLEEMQNISWDDCLRCVHPDKRSCEWNRFARNKYDSVIIGGICLLIMFAIVAVLRIGNLLIELLKRIF